MGEGAKALLILKGSMPIIAETWKLDGEVQLSVQRLCGISRITGLIGRAAPRSGEALLFPRCRAVHGVGLRGPIDVVFVGSGGLVLETRRLAPLGFVGCIKAQQTFEMRAGEVGRLGILPGSRLAACGEQGNLR